VAPPTDDELPKYGEYVYVEELPEAITKVAPQYPDLAREASVDGTQNSSSAFVSTRSAPNCG